MLRRFCKNLLMLRRFRNLVRRFVNMKNITHASQILQPLSVGLENNRSHGEKTAKRVNVVISLQRFYFPV